MYSISIYSICVRFNPVDCMFRININPFLICRSSKIAKSYPSINVIVYFRILSMTDQTKSITIVSHNRNITKRQASKKWCLMKER